MHGLPTWPNTPPDIDTTGTVFLVVAVGDDEETHRVARTWVHAAAAACPTRLLILDALSADGERRALERELANAVVGTRIALVGGQYDVLTAQAVCREAGAIAAELSAYVSHTRDLPVYCAHCRGTYRVESEPGGLVWCQGCGLRLEVHPHHSAARGSFLASAADARALP